MQVRLPGSSGQLYLPAIIKTVLFLVNAGNTAQTASFNNTNTSQQYKHMIFYKTGSSEYLAKHTVAGAQVNLPAQSVITVIMQ